MNQLDSAERSLERGSPPVPPARSGSLPGAGGRHNMYRGLQRIEIYGAGAIGVLGGVYIFGPAAKEAGDALKRDQQQPTTAVATPTAPPPPAPPTPAEAKKSWRD